VCIFCAGFAIIYEFKLAHHLHTEADMLMSWQQLADRRVTRVARAQPLLFAEALRRRADAGRAHWRAWLTRAGHGHPLVRLGKQRCW